MYNYKSEINKASQLILFVGDYVQLHYNYLGNHSDWLQVIDIEPCDICLLSNGSRVCASGEYIKAALSEGQYKAKNNV